MPRLEEINQTNQHKSTNTQQTENFGLETNPHPNSNQTQSTGLFSLPPSVMKLVP
jgi:hypothetical protein